jgi:tRNA pseudouridine32 synthase/23S rRNA pseudouridine746 synthase
MTKPLLPPRPSTLHLPVGHWSTVLDCLCAHFPAIGRQVWQQRMARGRVLDAGGMPLGAEHPYRAGLCVRYFREVPDEVPIPFEEAILHHDEHVLVADKPHFLPVIPSGAYVEQTLLARLIRRTGNSDLVPLHRIDRHTAGLLLFSCNAQSRGQYQALFRQRAIQKDYEALAAPLPLLSFPLQRATRLTAGEPFFRMQEVAGAANSLTQIEVIARRERDWLYALRPVTGKKHQLRVHMAALGAAIANDPFYPHLTQDEGAADDYHRPLKLLARGLAFIDPLSGERRVFTSRLKL